MARCGCPLLPVGAIQLRPASFSGTGAGLQKDRPSRERAILESRTLIRQLTEQPLLRDLPTDAAQAVLALRYCVLCRRNGRDPMPELERSEEHTSELQSLMRISYAVFCLKKKKKEK